MLYSRNLVQEVLERNDIVDIVSEYINLQKSGKEYKGLCPFHSEKTPSFMVNREKQVYHCFGCGASGNVITFIMGMENIDFGEAVRYLAEKCGISIYEAGKTSSENEKLYEINRIAALYYYRNLQSKNGERAFEYLKNRKIIELSIKAFGLGYAVSGWDNLLKYLRSKGYSFDLMMKAGLVLKREGYFDRFRDRIIFPIFDVKNRVIGFGGRTVGEGIPKYLNSPQTPIFNKSKVLYGLNKARKYSRENLIIVEGYMDVISLYQAGIKNVVASMGTSLTLDQAKLLKKYTKEVLIAYDTDTAGQEATLRGIEILREEGLEVKIIEIPDGKDPDEFVKNHGREGFIELIKNALSYTDYKLMRLEKNYDLKNSEGQIKYLREAIKIISKLDQLEREVYIKKVSESLKISERSIRAEIIKFVNRKNKDFFKNVYTNGNNRYNNIQLNLSESAYIKAEKNILKIMLNNPKYIDKIIENFNSNDFEVELHKKIFNIILSVWNKNKILNLQEISSYFKEPEHISYISELIGGFNDIDGDKLEMLLNDCIRLLTNRKIESKIKEIGEMIKKCFEENKVEEAKQLQSELEKLKKGIYNFRKEVEP